MENVTDALIMAGSVLIFIIALTICMSSYSNLRIGVDAIVGQTETVEMAKDSEGYINYLESEKSEAVRTVGAETVVTSISRAKKEDYVVYLKLIGLDETEANTYGVTVFKPQQELKKTNTNGLPVTLISTSDFLIKFTIGPDSNQNTRQILKNGLYDRISSKHFLEYLGEYQNNTEVSSENKQTKRIITYIEKN